MKLEGDASVLEEALSIFKDIPKAKAAIQDLLNIMTNHPTKTDNYQTTDLRGAEFTKLTNRDNK
jgi:hypothetical protein